MIHVGTSILLIEDNDDDAARLEALLTGTESDRFTVVRSKDLADGLERLGDKFDVVLVDLTLPDATGLSVVDRLLAVAEGTPIVVLANEADEETALQAMEVGAQQFLLKDSDQNNVLTASIRMAIERKRAEDDLAYLAQHDHLTGLVNRALFSDRLRHAIARSARDDRLLGLVILDVDGFEGVNSEHGTATGDLLLRSIGQRMRGTLRKVDTLGRFGSDEFALIAEDVKAVDHITLVAQKLLDAVTQPFFLEGREVTVTASVGTALFPFDGPGPDQLLAKAKEGLAAAKATGGNSINGPEA